MSTIGFISVGWISMEEIIIQMGDLTVLFIALGSVVCALYSKIVLSASYYP